MIPLIPPALIQAPAPKDFQAQCAALSKAKDWTGLEAFARSYAEAHPEDAASRAALGYAFFAQQRVKEGKEACEKAIALDPKRQEAYFYLGMQCATEGDKQGVFKWGHRLDASLPGAGGPYFMTHSIFCAIGANPDIPCFDAEDVKVLFQPPQPPYPELAKLARIQGTIVVDVTVGSDGVPRSATAICGPPQLRAHCEKYAMGWRFAVAHRDGSPSAFRWALMMRMRLDDQSPPSR